MSDDTQRILAALDRLEVKQDAMRADITTMRADITTMRADVTTMRADVTTMRADVMERIDRLQHTADQTRDELVVNFGNTDRVERTARAAIDDARITTDILRTMQRQIMRLQTDVDQLRAPP